MNRLLAALAALMLLIGPVAFSDPASAGHRHHGRHYAKHYAKHHRHVVRYPRYRRHYARYHRHHRNRVVVRFGYGGGCYNYCGCW
jgi:hypothetical protein